MIATMTTTAPARAIAVSDLNSLFARPTIAFTPRRPPCLTNRQRPYFS
jgi:hypothetical protein